MTSTQQSDGLSLEAAWLRVPYRGLGAFCAAIDFMAVVSASALAGVLHSGVEFDGREVVLLGVIAALVCVLIGTATGGYRAANLAVIRHSLRQAGLASSGGVVAVVVLFFLLKVGGQHSRGQILVLAMLAPTIVVLTRVGLSGFVSWGLVAGVISGSRVVLIGELAELDRLSARDRLNFGLSEVSRIGISRGEEADELTSNDRSRMFAAIDTARRANASEFAVIVPWSRDKMLADISSLLRASPLPVRLYPDHRTRGVLLRQRDGRFNPYMSVEIQRSPLSWIERFWKRGFDFCLAALGLVALSPLLIVIAFLIKLDSPGPIIFRQMRRGFDSQEFTILKFRTMRVLEDGLCVRQATRDDERITRLGRVLRRASLDELPQLLNVLKGEMSLVGPRPHAVAHDDIYAGLISQYALRRHVKPGLTGAAQVDGLRGETATVAKMQARVERDLWYINNWSIWLDLNIIIRTFVIIAGREAY